MPKLIASKRILSSCKSNYQQRFAWHVSTCMYVFEFIENVAKSMFWLMHQIKWKNIY
jgi:hypothetical protein